VTKRKKDIGKVIVAIIGLIIFLGLSLTALPYVNIYHIIVYVFSFLLGFLFFPAARKLSWGSGMKFFLIMGFLFSNLIAFLINLKLFSLFLSKLEQQAPFSFWS
jgi:hypothetical protein